MTDDDDSVVDPNYSSSSSASSTSSNSVRNSDSDFDIELVPLHSNADAENVKPNVRKGKKRLATPCEWRKPKAKRLRNMGHPYTSSAKSKKEYQGRTMRDPCNERKCRLKCASKINEDLRRKIFEKYWLLGDVTRQRDFISKCLRVIKPTYRYTKNEIGRRHNNAFYFEIDDEPIRVCKTFFKSTLDINDRPIRTVIAKKEAGFVAEDFRGKHNNHHQVDSEIKDGVRRHIESIPRIESHYLRQQTTREFIEGGKTLSGLYTDYKNDCVKNNLPFANLAMYSRIFNTEFNISFFTPKKDQCETCAVYCNTEGEEKSALQEQYNLHQEEKKVSRKEKETDKNRVSETFKVACYDLQAVFPCPKGETSSFYYSSKLNNFNFTVCELNSDRVECFVWHEGQGNRGANEIGSCVYKYLEETANSINSDDLEIILYSDNCCGQQKNRFMFTMYMYAVAHLKIKSISHKFLIKGHTQNEGDNVHSVIEKSIKRALKSGPIFVPSQFVTLIQTAKKKGRPYHVTEMAFDDFFDLKKLCDQYGNNVFKSASNEAFKITDVRVLRVEKEDPNTLFYKTSYLDKEFKQFKIKQTRRTSSRGPITLHSAYTQAPSLPEKKKSSLMGLVNSRNIPKYYSQFYNSLQ